MFSKIFKHWQIFFFLIILGIFFSPFILTGKIPLPADTIVGLYHPFRDKVWDDLIAGVPFKNFLITDPVRQQYVWREQAINSLKQGQIPLWNPYTFGGTPLLANIQTAIFNPLNILLLFLPFSFGWGLQVVLQLVLAGLFMYFWLRNLNLNKSACLLGSLTFCFSGFFVAWLEWNTIIQTALWLPLILLAKDKLIGLVKLTVNRFYDFARWDIFKWSLVLIFAETSSFFSGHIQTFFYIVIASTTYLFLRGIYSIRDKHKKKLTLLLFIITGLISTLLVSIQAFPFIELVLNSARSFDQPLGFRTDWYLPWQHLIQLFIPDFFGNPSTLNYFGKWNYGEFVSYIGTIPIILVILAVFFRRDKKTFFFSALTVIALIFSLPNVISFLPYQFHTLFISTTAPSRLIFLIDFSLAVLAALGLDFLIKQRNTKSLIISGLIISVLYGFFYLIVTFNFWQLNPENLLVAKRNLLFPTGLLLFGMLILFVFSLSFPRRRESIGIINMDHRVKPDDDRVDKLRFVLIIILLILASFDLLRFSSKFNSFTKKDWIFPTTKSIEFLQNQPKPFRIVSLDSRIMPPNFTIPYGIETIEGYDPIFALRYAEFWAALERGRPDISSFNFNRIITPQLYEDPLVNLLNVKYFLSWNEVNSKKMKLVFNEGQTKIYENINVGPRVFMVDDFILADNKQDAITKLFNQKNNLKSMAVIEDKSLKLPSSKVILDYESKIETYSANKILINVVTNKDALLILGDTYFTGWQATVDGSKTKIIRTDYILRGIVVPEGKHQVVFSFLPITFLLGLATTMLGFSFIFIWGLMVWTNRK